METPPAGYQNQSNQIFSQIYPASSSTASTIGVTLPTANGLEVTAPSPSYSSFANYFSSEPNWAAFTAVVDNQEADGTFGPFPVSATDTDGSIAPAAEFTTLCFDPLGPLQQTNQYFVSPSTTPTLPEPPYTQQPSDGPQIAYLFDQFATGVLGTLNQVQSAALQLAIFKLEFDPQASYTASDFSNTSENFYVTGFYPGDEPPGYDTNLNDYFTQAADYANLAVGQSATALFLNPSTVISGGAQGVLSTEILNFTNNGSTAPRRPKSSPASSRPAQWWAVPSPTQRR